MSDYKNDLRIDSRINKILIYFSNWVQTVQHDHYDKIVCPGLHDKLVNLVNFMRSLGVTDFDENEKIIDLVNDLSAFYHIYDNIEKNIKLGLAQDLVDMMSKAKMDNQILVFYSYQSEKIKKAIRHMIPAHLQSALRIME